MRQFVRLLLLTLAVLSASCSDEDMEDALPEDECLTLQGASMGEPIPGSYIVAFKDQDADNGRLADRAARAFKNHKISSDKIQDSFEGAYLTYILSLSKEEAAQLESDPAVDAVEQDKKISICSCLSLAAPELVTWNISKVGYGDGTGKTAWIMDTGIDLDHPDLNVDQQRSRSFVDGASSASDDNGHGTHVAGIIGARNNTFGTLGVASGATLVSIRILNNLGDGRLSIALKGLSYIRSNASAGDVVNISMSLGQVSEILESEIQSLASRKIYITIAAGNNGISASGISPAHTSGANIYTVSAVDSLDQFAAFSNYGEPIDYAAPGVRILSSYKGGTYAYMSGTSMAAPHVAGLLLINHGKINTGGYAVGDPDGSPDPIAHR